MILLPTDTVELREHLGDIEASTKLLRRRPEDSIFSPPLIVISQGIGKDTMPKVAFSATKVVFQDSLQSISAPAEDEDLLLFTSVYLRSKLARYFLFHTAANWGTERDKVLFSELMRLPLPLPGGDGLTNETQDIVEDVARRVRRLANRVETHSKILENEMEETKFQEDRRIWASKLQDELESSIYAYFDLTDQEIALVEDTIAVSIPSATPNNLHSVIPAQEPIHRNHIGLYHQGLTPYAETLQNTLNAWAKNAKAKVRASVSGGVHEATDMACVTISLGEKAVPFEPRILTDDTIRKLLVLAATASTTVGRLDYLRGLILFDGPTIHLFKPVALVNWTRTAALNDAAEIHAHIAQARQISGGTC